METITYKGIEYPIRVLNLKSLSVHGGRKAQYRIAPTSLCEAFGPDIETWDDTAKLLDETIYFYLEKDEFDSSGRDIAEKYLDIPFVFVSEE